MGRRATLAILATLGTWVYVGAAEVKIEVHDHQVINFTVGKSLVTNYHIDPEAAKPFFWPLNAPNGVPVMRPWPMVPPTPGEQTDHVHQKSGWFTYGDVIPEGVEIKQKIKGIKGVDFWSEAPGHGRIVCVKVGEPDQAKDHASIVTANQWQMADGVKIMDEKRTISLYLVDGERLLVVDSDLWADVCPITFGDTKEGAFGVRVRTEMTEQKGKGIITNAEGKTGEKNCWGRISAWCDYSGPLDGKEVGITLMADPNNPYPSCWHARGYGLMAANPFGRNKSGFPAEKGKTDLVKLAKGQHLKLRFGILLHDGDVKEGKAAECYAVFVRLGKNTK